MKRGFFLVAVLFVVAASTGAQSPSGCRQPVGAESQGHASAVRGSLGRLPLYFVENRGVHSDTVRYFIVGAEKTLFFTDSGVTVVLRGKKKAWTVKLDFVGANPSVRPVGLDKQEAVFSYFKGPEKDWKAGLSTFSKIVYRELWPGIDLVYNGTVNRLKYEFVVRPGADPARIRLRYRGITAVTATATGALKVETPEGSFEDASPVAWQSPGGVRVPVKMAYSPGKDGAFGFEVGEYNRAELLILDPVMIIYCGYIGGANDEEARACGIDSVGNVYVAGQTASTQTSFPVKVGPDITYNGGWRDTFVAKMDRAGTKLIYCGYIGCAARSDRCVAAAVDVAGSVYVVGETSGDEKVFPVKVGPSMKFGGPGGDVGDAFIAKVNVKGTALTYCGYIGGSGIESAQGVAVDANGSAYVVGTTTSSQSSFPVKTGPDLTLNGSGDGFIAKVKPDGTGLVYCGYIGGSAWREVATGVAVDSRFNAYVLGWTGSNEQTFPVKVGPDLSYNGGEDAFVAKVTPDGSALVYCGYVGGSGIENGSSIAVDAKGCAYVCGTTSSDETTFPVKVGPDLTYNCNSHPYNIYDGYVAKVTADGKSLVYCGYVGGEANDDMRAVAIDALGHAFLTGSTHSTESSFPVTRGPDLTFNGLGDAFVAKVSATGATLIYCGYIGGSSGDGGAAVAVDLTGNALVVGGTGSSESTFPVVSGPDVTFNGGVDTFVARIALTLLEGSGAPQPGAQVNFTLTATDDAGLPYMTGSSFSTGPIKIGNRMLGLGVDKLLEVSVGGVLPATFVGYQGLIGTNGQAAAKINLPSIAALVGQRIHTAFVTLGPTAPSGIKSISNTYSFTIVK